MFSDKPLDEQSYKYVNQWRVEGHILGVWNDYKRNTEI